MPYSQKSTPHVPDPPTVLVREGGVPYRPTPATDPLADWMDLMEAIEVLCPRWPARDQPRASRGFVL